MFKDETFEMWDDNTKAINMSDHATPPEDMDEAWDNWGGGRRLGRGSGIHYRPCRQPSRDAR